ncbi:MAG: hypothetical protein A2428_11815 [Bdellovibrionales bacterium RIFOXYC1_FULL_54_43]|nr:MAG: hypothetical protein A2428_11815 [Bdellovibrionales bacterium RIFOXYC1_FULL_54_43]
MTAILLLAAPAWAEADIIQALSQWKTIGLLGGSLACLGGVGAGAALRGIPNAKLSAFGNDVVQGSFIGLLAIGFASVAWALIQKVAGVSIQ